MAGKTTVVPSLQKLKKELTCSKCRHFFTDPRVLPTCQHPFCLACIQGLSTWDSSVSCPKCLCRNKLPLPAQNVHYLGTPIPSAIHLPAATPLNTLRELYDQMKSEEVICEMCDCDNCTKTKASNYCKNCGKSLCRDCTEMHNKWSDFANHQLTISSKQQEKTSQSKGLYNIRTVASSIALQQCKARAKEIEFCPINQVSFHMTIQILDFKVVLNVLSLKCSLLPDGKGLPLTGTVSTTTSPGEYTVHFTTPTSGPHQVIVYVQNIQIQGTSIIVPFSNRFNNITPFRIIYDLNRPKGVAVSDDGHIIITENNGRNGCVSIFNQNGQKLKSFDGFSSPRGVTITRDNFIFVTSDAEVHKIEECLSSIAVISEQTLSPNKSYFSNPIIGNNICMNFTKEQGLHGLAISPITGRVYIADSTYKRVQILTCDLKPCRTFDLPDWDPTDIAIDSKGLVYVTDTNSTKIHKFTHQGSLVTSFSIKAPGSSLSVLTKSPTSGLSLSSASGLTLTSGPGIPASRIQPTSLASGLTGLSMTSASGSTPFNPVTGPSSGIIPVKLIYPMGITINRSTDRLYVTEGLNHRICVLTNDGQFVRSYGAKGINEDQFNNPCGIAYHNGVLYVCDYSNNRLVMY